MKQHYPLENPSFPRYYLSTKNQVEVELSKYISKISQLDIFSEIEYAVLSPGKRFRPILVILSAESVGGERTKVMPLAIAFELIHTATLVHDDIIDQAETRRGKMSLNKKWSTNEAILTGDALIALSISLASSYDEKVIKTVAQSALELCEGEHLDLCGSLKTITEEVYFKRIKAKTASLCQAASYCGAVAGGGTVEEINYLSNFGENFGMAYQLRDDLLDFISKETYGLRDINDNKITLPLIHCYAHSTKEERKHIEKLHKIIRGNPSHADDEIDELMQTICNKSSLQYCERKIDYYLSSAFASIVPLKDTYYKQYLIKMVKALTKMGGAHHEKQNSKLDN